MEVRTAAPTELAPSMKATLGESAVSALGGLGGGVLGSVMAGGRVVGGRAAGAVAMGRRVAGAVAMGSRVAGAMAMGSRPIGGDGGGEWGNSACEKCSSAERPGFGFGIGFGIGFGFGFGVWFWVGVGDRVREGYV